MDGKGKVWVYTLSYLCCIHLVTYNAKKLISDELREGGNVEGIENNDTCMLAPPPLGTCGNSSPCNDSSAEGTLCEQTCSVTTCVASGDQSASLPAYNGEFPLKNPTVVQRLSEGDCGEGQSSIGITENPTEENSGEMTEEEGAKNPVLKKQETFSMENEREEGVEDKAMSLKRYVL